MTENIKLSVTALCGVALLGCATPSHQAGAMSCPPPTVTVDPPSTRDDTRTRVIAHRGAVQSGLESPNEETVLTQTKQFPSQNEDGTINVIIEIPSGTNAKFEVEKDKDVLKLEYKNQKPRLIDFLPYPSNYGSVPKTLVDPDEGGDGDPVDVIVLGPALERGSVVPARIIGALKMLDQGEVDHKLIAVTTTEHGGFANLRTLRDMRARYPAALKILEMWFKNYKGPGQVEIEKKSWVEASQATAFFESCVKAYAAHLGSAPGDSAAKP